jgi:hypothetical protein
MNMSLQECLHLQGLVQGQACLFGFVPRPFLDTRHGLGLWITSPHWFSALRDWCVEEVRQNCKGCDLATCGLY